MRVRAEQLDLYLGSSQLLSLPRLRGQQQHQIDYRHLIGSLVRKPGAFAQYRYHDALFPSLVFRQTYDALGRSHPATADREYVQLLHLAATTSEVEIETALSLLLDAGQTPTVTATRALIRAPHLPVAPQVDAPTLDLRQYDQLLGGVVAA